MKKIAIKPSKHCRKFSRDNSPRFSLAAWGKSPAFAVNVRGILTHRVLHVTTYYRDGQKSHYHVDYVCGNGCNVELANIEQTLVSDPPKERLLCDFCEIKAKRHKLPTGDKLAGRHVHRGVLTPIQTCCQEKEEPR